MALHDGAKLVGILLVQVAGPVQSLTNFQLFQHLMEGVLHHGKGSDFRGDGEIIPNRDGYFASHLDICPEVTAETVRRTLVTA